MKRKGINFKRARHLYFRPCQEADLASKAYTPRVMRCDWEPSRAAYVVIISVKDCLDDQGEWDHDRVEDAPARPFTGWSRTNMVYGPYRKQTQGRRFWVRLNTLTKKEQRSWRKGHAADVKAGRTTLDTMQHACFDHDGEDADDPQVHHWFDTYWTSSTYWVEDACVYRATSHTHEDPTK